MVPTVVHRPFISIQHDWDEAFKMKDETVWVSCKEIGSTSKQGKITCKTTGIEAEVELQAEDGFSVENFSGRSITILHQDPNAKCIFFAPSRKFSNIHEKSIVSLDVTPKGLGVSVCANNKLVVWDTENGSVLRTLEGHIWDVYSCCFFPSGIVVLSGGADMQIKIWSAETGKCPVTLRGHTAAITDTCIVERGRNIISVSKDGTARLWDCGESHCLDIVSRQEGSINCCSVSDVNINLGQTDGPRSEREIGTEGKLLILGCENGTFCGVGLRSRKTVFQYKNPSAINCCCYLLQTKVVCGAQDGTLFCFDLSNMNEPCIVWEESASPVLCLLPVKDGFFAGRADGTCMFMPLTGDLAVQLTGPAFDPVYCIACDGQFIYTGSRDGMLRKYHLPDSISCR